MRAQRSSCALDMVTCDRFTSPKQPLVRRSGTASQARARGAHPTSAEERVPDPHTRPAPGGPDDHYCPRTTARGAATARRGPRSPIGCSPPPGRSPRPVTPASPCPGAEGGYGRDVDGLEGSPALSCWPASASPASAATGCDDLIDWYAHGHRDRHRPGLARRWVRLDEHAQAKVEAASIALILDLTRPWIWDRLDAGRAGARRRLPRAGRRRRQLPAEQLALVPAGRADLPALGRRPLVGRRHGRRPRHARLASSAPTAGSSDGAERAYDHYVGWALHLYPMLWSRMAGAGDLAAGRRGRGRRALDRYLTDAHRAGRRATARRSSRDAA